MASINVRRSKLVVDFTYCNQRCREQTVLDDNPKNRRDLKKLTERMEAEITLGSFDYQKYFPRSKRAEEMTSRALRIKNARSAVPIFSSFTDIWFEERKIEWRISYRGKIMTILNNYLLPYFGKKAIDQIVKADLLEFRASLGKVTHGKSQASLTASRINQIMTQLSMILQEASDRYEFESPYRNIKNLKESKVDVKPFTLDEAWKIIRFVRPDYRVYYTVRFFTGMRTSEIDGLRWKNIDLERKEIYIREALVNGNLGGPKTAGSNRVIQMSEVVYEAFEGHLKRDQGRSEYVFSTRIGKPLDYHNVNKRVWHPTLAILGLDPRRAYQTRHTAATLWLAAGESPEWIARQLGHSNTEMLFRVYSRYVPDITRKDGSAFEALLKLNMNNNKIRSEVKNA
jgi:integrase